MKSNPLLSWYRALAYATGCMLLLLCGFMVAKYGFGVGKSATFFVAQAHGILFMGYVVVAFLLGQKQRWGLVKQLLILVAGTIPFCSFVAERRVVREVRGEAAGKAAPAPVRV
ncbi:DUF3817 domain-containing protein [Streptacidiphilus griseoplanus]|uniref:DUF3817 domain-containing protein n=1 Tax=Peterkaempfera griseoplana TaxID=66896 RepID=UPI001FE1D94E|nr:DUF3817 domain-containing protein [Peterkaempfera griseoplana]